MRDFNFRRMLPLTSVSPDAVVTEESPSANEFGSTTSRVAAAKTNLNAARARVRESDSAERKATADQLIARPLSFRSRHPTSAGAKLSFCQSGEEPGSAPLHAIRSTLLAVVNARARTRALTHHRNAKYAKCNSPILPSRPINRPPIVKAESRVALPSREKRSHAKRAAGDYTGDT